MITGLVNLNIVGLHGKGSATARAVEDVSRRTGPAPKLRSSRIQGTMKCCKAAHVILDFGVNGLATYTTRAVLGRIFPVFYGRADKMGGLRISSNVGYSPDRPSEVPITACCLGIFCLKSDQVLLTNL